MNSVSDFLRFPKRAEVAVFVVVLQSWRNDIVKIQAFIWAMERKKTTKPSVGIAERVTAVCIESVFAVNTSSVMYNIRAVTKVSWDDVGKVVPGADSAEAAGKLNS